MKNFVTLLFMLAVAIPLGGWVLSVLWEWFIVPGFHVASLSVPIAIGIDLVASFLLSGIATKNDVADAVGKGSTTEMVVRAIVTPLFFLALGALFHLFV